MVQGLTQKTLSITNATAYYITAQIKQFGAY
jgi:hypothetical protein